MFEVFKLIYFKKLLIKKVLIKLRVLSDDSALIKCRFYNNPVKMLNDSQRNSEIPSNLVFYVLRIVKI